MIHVATSLFASVRSLANFVHDGSFGKTSPTSCMLNEAGRLEPCLGGWLNSGMGSPTEFVTLNTSESPNAAAGCLLSGVLETGDVPPEHSLSPHNIQRMQQRLKKYASTENPLLTALECFSDGRETKHQNMESRSSRLSGHSKEARASG